VGTSGSGTTVLLLVAAVLWLIYLVPLWMKRSEYYATERNAARLGQTLRLLANTTEASAEIKAELRARAIVRKEKEAERALRRISRPELTVAERRRRTKQVFSLTLLIGVVAFVTAYLAAWPLQVIWASSTVVTISLTVLGRVNRVGQLEALQAQAQGRAALANTTRRKQRTWTPQPVPEPLSTGGLPEVSPLPSHDELVKQATAAAVSKRPEDFEGDGLAIVSPFARMGTIEAQPTERLNLDEVLKRRRAV
jgi:ABC-type transport system involved in cytochrome bd biosynthesis fused ATPase/permease subunit